MKIQTYKMTWGWYLWDRRIIHSMKMLFLKLSTLGAFKQTPFIHKPPDWSPALWTVGRPVWVALLFTQQRHSWVLFFIKKNFFLIRRKEEGRRSLTDERANPVENSFCSFQCLPCVIGICLYFPPLFMSSLMAQWVKNPPVILETWVCSPGQEDPLEEEMATHSSVLAWEISWTEEPSGSLWGCKESDTTEQLNMHTCHRCTQP